MNFHIPTHRYRRLVSRVIPPSPRSWGRFPVGILVLSSSRVALHERSPDLAESGQKTHCWSKHRICMYQNMLRFNHFSYFAYFFLRWLVIITTLNVLVCEIPSHDMKDRNILFRLGTSVIKSLSFLVEIL